MDMNYKDNDMDNKDKDNDMDNLLVLENYSLNYQSHNSNFRPYYFFILFIK